MLFNSLSFAAFFLVFFVAFVVTDSGKRLPLIIAGSFLFYGYWKPVYFWIPLALSATGYWGTIWMMQPAAEGRRRGRLVCVIVALFLPLVAFKYLHFFLETLEGVVPFAWMPEWRVDLPLGISFITFTVTAYVVDVYAGKFELAKKAKEFLAYILFFPHLIAGPILRPSELLPQMRLPANLTRENVMTGSALFALGLLKKVVIADYMSPLVDRVYAHAAVPGLFDAGLAFYGFSIQIYCDFSGYTDMALGLALMLGYRLPGNFSAPYAAGSVVEFWRHWHMTLSRWLRDYLYIPLGGNRAGFAKQLRNLLVVVLLGGLWHGANWTFIAWGAFHGLGMVFVRAWQAWDYRPMRLPRGFELLPVLLTFHFVSFGWIFFRAPDFATAGRVMTALVTVSDVDPMRLVGANKPEMVLMLAFFLLHRYDRHELVLAKLKRLPPHWAWLVIVLTIWTALAFAAHGTGTFIYFEF